MRTVVSLGALGLSLFMLWHMRLEVAYALSPRDPITLGVEGDYHFDLARSNRYAQVHGTPALRGIYLQTGKQTRMAVPLQGTPLVIVRSLLGGEALVQRGKSPPPNPQPLALRGRLLSPNDAGRYGELLRGFVAGDKRSQGIKPTWLLIQGDRPGADLSDTLIALVLVIFAGLNGWVAWRRLRLAFG